MTALALTVTTAGYAAYVNAKNNGTNALLVASVGVTSAVFNPTAALTALPGEIKRLSTISGGVIAANTIHVTINDSSADTYALLGIGIYLSDGTLFATFGQATTILEKSSQAAMLLACDIQFANIAASSLTFGDTDFQLNQATTTALGVIQLATNAQAIAGTDSQLAVVPAAMLATLDARLGAGAPTTFVQTLLSAATAVIFRTALAIKGAALYDPGHGNGLDADTLDGNQGAYYAPINSGALTGVPTAPTAAAGTNSAQLATTAFMQNALVPMAPLASPALTGVPTAPTAALGTNSTQIATMAAVQAAITALIGGAPGALDTLKELADSIGDNANYAASVTTALAARAALTGAAFTGAISAPAVTSGGSAVWTTGNLSPIPAGANTITTGTTVSSGNPPNMAGLASATNANVALTISNNNNVSASAVVGFLRGGQFAAFFGIDTDNQWKVGGWSMGAAAYRVVHEGLGAVNLPGSLTVAGQTVSGGGFQISDERLKYSITDLAPRPLHRVLNHKQWLMLDTDKYGCGATAQNVLDHTPEYTGEFDHPCGEKRLGVDKAGIALEQSLWAGGQVDALHDIVRKLSSRLAALECAA